MVSEGAEQGKSERAWKIVLLEVVMVPRESYHAEGYANDYKAVWFPKAQGVDHCREEEVNIFIESEFRQDYGWTHL